ncbi:MAG TPA: hypothetical protein VF006_28365 [Longimicrobium sp.]
MRFQSLVRPLVTLLLLLLGQGTSLASAAGLTCARRAESAPAAPFANTRGAAESHRQGVPAPDHDSAPEAPAPHAVATCTAPAMPVDASPWPAYGTASAAALPARLLPPVRLLADSQFRPPRLS